MLDIYIKFNDTPIVKFISHETEMDHIQKMAEDRMPKKVLEYCMIGKRKKVR